MYRLKLSLEINTFLWKISIEFEFFSKDIRFAVVSLILLGVWWNMTVGNAAFGLCNQSGNKAKKHHLLSCRELSDI